MTDPASINIWSNIDPYQ